MASVCHFGSFAEVLEGLAGCIRCVARRIVVVVYQPIESNYLIQVANDQLNPAIAQNGGFDSADLSRPFGKATQS
jgi:hypothetical protein